MSDGETIEERLEEAFQKPPVEAEKIETPAEKFASELDNPNAFTTPQIIYRRGDGNIIRHPQWGTNFQKNEDFDPTHVDKWDHKNPIPDGVKWVPERPADSYIQKLECDPAFVKSLSGATKFFVDMVYKGVKERLMEDQDFLSWVGSEINDAVEGMEVDETQVSDAVESYLENADLPDDDAMRGIAEEVFNDSIGEVKAELSNVELEVTVRNADISLTRW